MGRNQGNFPDKKIFRGKAFLSGMIGVHPIGIPQQPIIDYPYLYLKYLVYVQAYYNRQVAGVFQNPKNSEGFATISYEWDYAQWRNGFTLNHEVMESLATFSGRPASRSFR